jgi:hypothetical protein
MSDEPRRMIEIGVLPRASEIFADGADPLSVMIADAERRLDQERAQQAEDRSPRPTDPERLRLTREARLRGRLRKLVQMTFRGHRRLPR